MASSYIDDIYVNEDVPRVREHLAQFGVKCKDPEQLEDGTWVLKLTVGMECGGKEKAWSQKIMTLLRDGPCSSCVGGFSSISKYVSVFVWLA